ncbi:50S ribosomal protein L20 [Candidatus Carsonella ruddii]|uniref:50S ribosomal protein L20 n=1 Tax=Carsonella ruddii TaxID=114186 RepID=UPI003D509E9C
MTRSKKKLQIKKRKKILNFTKGYIGRKKNCFKSSKQYYLRSLYKRYISQKLKKIFFNKKKNVLLNVMFRTYFGLSYNKIMFLLKKNYCIINKLKIILLLLETII